MVNKAMIQVMIMVQVVKMQEEMKQNKEDMNNTPEQTSEKDKTVEKSPKKLLDGSSVEEKEEEKPNIKQETSTDEVRLDTKDK
jgi:hypothetical protein